MEIAGDVDLAHPAGGVLGRARSTLRYCPKQRSGEEALIKAIRRFARRHPRYGYKKVHALLNRDGWGVNGKRVRGWAVRTTASGDDEQRLVGPFYDEHRARTWSTKPGADSTTTVLPIYAP